MGMLEKIRRGTVKILVFALFAILILSFAVWGIGDVIRTGGQGPIAEVGDKAISPQEFTTALNQRRMMLTQQFGQPLSPEQLRAFGLDAAVLGELVNSAAISNHAKSLGLRLSDEAVADMIRADPIFHGPDNTFSRAVFDERMRQAGFTEQRYFAERREGEIRDQLSSSLLEGVRTPDAMVGVVHRYREEERTASYLRLDPQLASDMGEPDEAALKALYEEEKTRAFTTPERRKIAVLLLTMDQLRQRTEVSEAEIRATWEQSRAAWDLPERRRIQQISYRTKAEAEGEAKAIAEGKGFLLAALEANGAQGQLDQGLIARREISDPNYGQAAFELPLNTVSAPVQVRGGWLLLRVTEIVPARERPFEEVKDEIRRSLEDNRLRDLIHRLHDEIEDKRGASAANEKLKAIATELDLKLIEADGVDARGRAPDGSPAIDHPEAERFVASAFEGDPLTPRDVITLADGGEAWVEVVDVTPAATQPFEEVKDEVEKLWRERQTRAALASKAQAAVDRLNAGETLEDVATGLGLEVRSTGRFKRFHPPEGLSAAAARLAFTVPQGGTGTAATADGNGRIVFTVTAIHPAAPPTEAQMAQIRGELSQEMQRDLLETYIATLRQRQGVKINEGVYRRTVGLDQQ